MDSWFKPVPIAPDLIKRSYQLTAIGTMRRSKCEIPPELLDLNKPKGEPQFFGMIKRNP